MLFHQFKTQQERRAFGGSEFIEIQYCRIKKNTPLSKIVSVEHSDHWKTNSLYVYGDDISLFFSEYGEIITDGFYSNGERGMIDPYGINYFTPEQMNGIVHRLENEKPREYRTLHQWLRAGEECNGFYILGI